jgi:hypothetical protein
MNIFCVFVATSCHPVMAGSATSLAYNANCGCMVGFCQQSASLQLLVMTIPAQQQVLLKRDEGPSHHLHAPVSLSAPASAVQIYDMYGEEGLKGGAPPPGAAGGADGMPGGMPGGATFFSFGGPGGGYSGMDSARAANIFASLFGQHGAEAFGGAGGAGPRSRVRMFSRKGSGSRRGMEDMFGDGAGTHYFHDGGMGARPAGSGTTGYAWGGGGEWFLQGGEGGSGVPHLLSCQRDAACVPGVCWLDVGHAQQCAAHEAAVSDFIFS